MLTVKTYLAKSFCDGIGIFAAEDIPKGKIIWEYFPMIDITYEELEWGYLEQNLDNKSFENLRKYAYKEGGKYIVCTDNAQFMNHDQNEYNVSNTTDLKSMYANRKIVKGEELLCNYREYSDNDDYHLQILNSLDR